MPRNTSPSTTSCETKTECFDTPDKESMQTMYDRIRENIESTWPDWKIELANAELITSKHGKKLRTKAEREKEETLAWTKSS